MSTQVAGQSPQTVPELDLEAPSVQRRWTVLLRVLLLIPHFIVLYFVQIAAAVVSFLGWFAALAIGRLPEWIADFLELAVGYQTRVNASYLLLVDTYPPFVTSTPDFPVRIEIPRGPQNRLTVFFRFLLVIPVSLLLACLTYGWLALGFFVWLIVLVAGKTPQVIFEANAAWLRFQLRTQAYAVLLTSTYPKRPFGDAAEDGPGSSATRPLVLSSGGRGLLIAYLVLGVLSLIGIGVSSALAPDPQAYALALGN